MRSVRPEGAAGSRLRAFIEEFPSPARVAAYANLPTPLGVARGDMCNRISFVPTGITCHHFGKLTPHTYARALAADGAADGAGGGGDGPSRVC